MRNMVMTSLRQTNLGDFEFVEAEDGADALSKFNVKNTDIVFVDWNMPNMSGIDFVRKVRKIGKTEHIPIVMVTSEKTMGKLEEALDQAGANAYVTKPFTVEFLQRKISPLLEGMKAKESKGGFFSRLVSG